MASELSNEAKYLLLLKAIDLANDTCKIILMASGFVFSKVTHTCYADVSASELPTALGYTAGGVALTTPTVSKDDTNNVGKCIFDNVEWTATGGNLTARGAIIFDDTVSSPKADPVIGYIDFGSNQTTADTGTFTISNITVAIS